MKLQRFFKHRWIDHKDVERLLPQAAVENLQTLVQQSERHHSGEICICVEGGLPLSYLWKGLSARQRAVTLFGKLRVWDTDANNGVLIYLQIADRAIEIVADRGLNAHVTAAEWLGVVAALREQLKAGGCEAGLIEAVAAVDALLTEHFPLRPGTVNRNELPDRVVVL